MQKIISRKKCRFIRMIISCQLALAFFIVQTQGQTSHASSLVVDANAARIAVPSTMWGIFFEDINFAADGGIYAELIKNRSFEFTEPFMGWESLEKMDSAAGINYNGKALIARRGPIEMSSGNWGNNHRFVRLTVRQNYGLRNRGFRGMGFHKDEYYLFSALIRTDSKFQIQLKLTDSLHNKDVNTEWSTIPVTGKWQQIQLKIRPGKDLLKGQLEILFKGDGQLDADMLSFFPEHTWKNRPGGLRADLVQKLANLQPGFIRFPGGCIVEGRTLANRYQWKNTVGPVSKRKVIVNRWNTEFRAPRNAPDYFQSYGLGFFEYFQLAEDLEAEPLPILNCGMACQFNSGELALELGPYIQDALDLIEFANGDTTSKWGRLRNKMGHPAPFNLKMLGIGNEQWDIPYFERYRVFANVLRAKHPEIKLVSGTGPYAEGKWFDQAWDSLRLLQPALVDEHYYKPPAWFLANAGRYDHYNRSGPKVFAGEYAAHGKNTPDPTSGNSWYSALTEAAFMTGLERNADVVQLASYAPLLAHIDAWQWRPDLIWFNNLTSMATPNYYVQQLFSKAKGNQVIATTYQGKPAAGSDSLYASTTLDSAARLILIKMVNAGNKPLQVPIEFKGIKIDVNRKGSGTWELLTSEKLYAYNSLSAPAAIQPKKINFDLNPKKITAFKSANMILPNFSKKDRQLQMTLPPYSVSLITLPIDPAKPSQN